MTEQSWGDPGGSPDPHAAGRPAGWQPPGPPPGPPVPPGPPGQWYGPPGGYPWAPPRPTNGMAVASMVLGILWIYWIGSVLALVFGYVARKQIRERGEGGAGMAVAGIVLGWVGVGFLAFVLLFALGAASF